MAGMQPIAVVLGVALAGTAPARAQTAPDYDFEWRTIGAVHNPAYTGETFNGFPRPGTGAVGYEYRMARTEVTAAQYLEFLNAAGSLGDPWGIGGRAQGGGVEPIPGIPGRYALAPGLAPERRFMTKISWRDAALYCNWLHNDKRIELDAFTTGAYDTSTWGENPPGVFPRFTDAPTRMPGAKFWIPSVSEWIKAVHYDPAKDGGQGGYWLYPNSSDTSPIPGQSPLLGGDGQTNAGYLNYSDQLSYRVGMYPDVQSPWGLLDTSGGASEWMEDWGENVFQTHRFWDGSPATYAPGIQGAPNLDLLSRADANMPIQVRDFLGLRLASAIPAPSAFLPLLAGAGLFRRCRRTRV